MSPHEERTARRLGATVALTFSLFAATSFGVAFIRTDAAPQPGGGGGTAAVAASHADR
jgi:hypothetical protein